MDEFMDEFMAAMAKVFPQLVIQFEDFSTENAFKYLARYRNCYRVFNDDVRHYASFLQGNNSEISFLDSRHRICCPIRFPQCGTHILFRFRTASL